MEKQPPSTQMQKHHATPATPNTSPDRQRNACLSQNHTPCTLVSYLLNPPNSLVVESFLAASWSHWEQLPQVNNLQSSAPVHRVSRRRNAESIHQENVTEEPISGSLLGNIWAHLQSWQLQNAQTNFGQAKDRLLSQNVQLTSLTRRLGPTPSWEGTLKGGLKGDLKVTLRSPLSLPPPPP